MSKVPLTPPSYRDKDTDGSGIATGLAASPSLAPRGHRGPYRPKSDPQIDAALERARESLKRFREQRHISISKWEEEAGLGQGTLGKFIRGATSNPKPGTKRTKPSRDIGLEALLRLAAAQNTTVAELIGEGPSPPPSAAVDTQLLTDILVELERYLQKTGDIIRPADKVLVAMVLYDTTQRDRRGKFVMDDLAIKILKLALKKPQDR